MRAIDCAVAFRQQLRFHTCSACISYLYSDGKGCYKPSIRGRYGKGQNDGCQTCTYPSFRCFGRAQGINPNHQGTAICSTTSTALSRQPRTTEPAPRDTETFKSLARPSVLRGAACWTRWTDGPTWPNTVQRGWLEKAETIQGLNLKHGSCGLNSSWRRLGFFGRDPMVIGWRSR